MCQFSEPAKQRSNFLDTSYSSSRMAKSAKVVYKFPLNCVMNILLTGSLHIAVPCASQCQVMVCVDLCLLLDNFRAKGITDCVTSDWADQY